AGAFVGTNPENAANFWIARRLGRVPAIVTEHFDSVEIDSTFYATPNVSVVRSWNAKTPEGFLFAAKVPQEITHKRVLKHCDEEFKIFLTTMEALGEKLGPLLFQFGRFDETVFESLDDFLGSLIPFLKGFRRSTNLLSRFVAQKLTLELVPKSRSDHNCCRLSLQLLQKLGQVNHVRHGKEATTPRQTTDGAEHGRHESRGAAPRYAHRRQNRSARQHRPL